MTRKDVEIALIQMGKAMKTIMAAYAPDANQTRVSVVNGTIMVYACRYDDINATTNDVYLDAALFTDGSMNICGEYIPAKEDVA